jgi:hypothetical protein
MTSATEFISLFLLSVVVLVCCAHMMVTGRWPWDGRGR